MNICLLDASVMIALFDRSDRFHAHFHQLLVGSDTLLQLHSTWPCVVEASHLLGPRHRLALLQWIAHGAVQIFPFDAQDLLEMCVWMERYTQQPRTEMDMADGSL
ncbi:MAG: hypothetical protein LBE59_04010, partial [Nevskiaceae bacterium]|nr:hypothetical protein [Nevskiaceae bacterium]